MNLFAMFTIILAIANCIFSVHLCCNTRLLDFATHLDMFRFRVDDSIFLWGESCRFFSFDPKENVNNTGEGPQKMKHNVQPLSPSKSIWYSLLPHKIRVLFLFRAINQPSRFFYKIRQDDSQRQTQCWSCQSSCQWFRLFAVVVAITSQNCNGNDLFLNLQYKSG